MWRRNAVGFGDDVLEDEDSDQSISEEDEGLDGEWARNIVSLGDGENDKGKMHVLSEIEIFRESHELHSTEESISSHGKKGGYPINDEVETPIFNDGDSPIHYPEIASASHAHSTEGLICLPHVDSVSYSDEEIISDDEKINPLTLRSGRDDLTIAWSEANLEVEALVQSKENTSSSSNLHDVFAKEKKSTGVNIVGGGGRRKATAKFSFRYHTDKKDLSLTVRDSNAGTSSDNIADEIGAATDDEKGNYITDCQLNVHDNQLLPLEMAHKHGTRGHSMAEILSGYLEKSGLKEGSSKLKIQKRSIEQTVLENDLSPLDDIIQEYDDLPEAFDSDTSLDSEENAQRVKSIISSTVANQFHEAFREFSAIDDGLHVSFPIPLIGGIYRRLQQVMQIEKERDTDSLRKASTETDFKVPDEGTPVLVRILSRSLEAKLIVCSCSCVGDGKNSSRETDLDIKSRGITRFLTIIFNPRMSSDVDLEVGNLIRIHPPWKEVKVNDEVIFLCSHFSQVQL